jgi:GNAT superfamily N-acetyltransferase
MRDVRLRDGTAVTIRPIRPDDRRGLEEAFERLSGRSRYLRFHAPVDHLTDAQLRFLTEVDHDTHVALVAVPRDEAGPGLGVARYVRLTQDRGVAEAAVVVVDAWQGRGLGTLLLAALATRAARGGVRVFRNYVLAENTPVVALFDQLGAERKEDEPGVYRIDLTLPADMEDLPDTPAGRVFKAAARGQLPPLHPQLPPVWGERPDLREWLDQTFGG